MYDLTSFLTTISAGSASFAAILGGMIATKVIEINNTRFAVEEEIKELTEKREFYEKDLQRISTARSEDHAICFIGNHVEQFLGEYSFAKMCKVVDDLDAEEDLTRLGQYWSKALDVLRIYSESEALNEREMVQKIQKEAMEDRTSADMQLLFTSGTSFVKGICEIIKDHIAAYRHNHAPMRAGEYSFPMPYLNKRIEGYGVSMDVWQEWRKQINENVKEMDLIDLRISQLVKKKKALFTPPEMKSGLYLFGVFIAVCVVLPLFFIPFETERYEMYLAVKGIFILLFAAGLFSTLLFFGRMLKGKANKSKIPGKEFDK